MSAESAETVKVKDLAVNSRNPRLELDGYNHLEVVSAM